MWCSPEHILDHELEWERCFKYLIQHVYICSVHWSHIVLNTNIDFILKTYLYHTCTIFPRQCLFSCAFYYNSILKRVCVIEYNMYARVPVCVPACLHINMVRASDSVLDVWITRVHRTSSSSCLKINGHGRYYSPKLVTI
jgi:hypothetical protein